MPCQVIWMLGSLVFFFSHFFCNLSTIEDSHQKSFLNLTSVYLISVVLVFDIFLIA
ncbi:uncharacterized protein EV154DRAFT_508211 [Mucor mucedo]|uniref:uncharacterized protein n=1 Tax=Mucor mucedo TaxID=29922 RepID=UPI002220A9B7|nr:uncharacterized protein EV154DRAFT_508211 [Mucor mucedo]KAI7891422.1 hypothetical protein EV154DRAFT_508211 [Mucor mucedo]